MWTLGIGGLEILYVLLYVPPLFFCRGFRRTLAGTFLGIALVSVLLSPADLASTLALSVSGFALVGVGILVSRYRQPTG